MNTITTTRQKSHQSAVTLPQRSALYRPAAARRVTLSSGSSVDAGNDDVDGGGDTGPRLGSRRRLRRRGRRAGKKVKIFRGEICQTASNGSAQYQPGASGIGTQSCRVGCHNSSRAYDRAHLLTVRGQVGGDKSNDIVKIINRSLPANLSHLIRRPAAHHQPSRVIRQTGLQHPPGKKPQSHHTTKTAIKNAPATQRTSKLIMCHQNVRSLIAKIDQIRELMHKRSIAIMYMTETHLSSGIDNRALCLPGYCTERSDRTTGGGGGVAVSVRDDLGVERLASSSIIPDSKLESIWLKIKLRRDTCIVVGCIYRPPGTASLSADLEDFENQYEEAIRLRLPVYIMGDFNIDLSSSDKPGVQLLLSTASDLGLTQLVSSPTRIASVNRDGRQHTSSTLIDLAYTNTPDDVTEVTVEEHGISDHKCVLLSLCVPAVRNSKKLITFRSTRHLNEDAIKLDFLVADWQPVYSAVSVDDKWAAWLHIWDTIVDAHCPTVTKPAKSTPTPWLHNNPELTEAILNRNRAHSRADRSGSPSDWAAYHDLRRRASLLMANAKNNYFSSLIDESKNIWPEVRKYIMQKKALPTSTQSRPSQDEVAAFADKQNHHFASTASRIAATMQQSDPSDTSAGASSEANSAAQPRPPRVVSSAFKLTPATLPELSRALRTMNNTKACGEDGVSLQLLKTVFPVVGPHLLHVINFSLMSGTVPSDWKMAVIVPLHKKGASDDPRNFRPISLLSNVSKLCEKIVLSQLRPYLISNFVLNETQHAFLPGHSTETALAEAIAFITSHLDNKEIVSLASVDLSSAFDCVDHSILLRKLGWYGIDPTWFRDYLSNRHQRVRGGRSVERVKAGVPQGSLTGPILFLLYTNDLPSHLDCKIISYADDTQMLVPSKISEVSKMTNSLEINISRLRAWYHTNRLKLNASKTQFVIFCTRQMQRQLPKITLSLSDAEITPATSLKNLGVTMDCNLTWSEHVGEIAQKCNRIIFPLMKHSHSLSQPVLSNLIQTLVLPHLFYCAPIWGALCINQRQRLQKVVNRAARMVTKTPRSAHITPVLEQLGWRSIEATIKHRDAMLAYHAVCSSHAPACLRSLFKPRAEVSERRTRAKDNALALPRVRTELARRSLQYRAAAVWNSLPGDAIDALSKVSFNSRLPF